MTIGVALGLALVVAGAALVQSISGFGFALLSVPLMALLIDAKDAVVVAALFGLASSTVLATRVHQGVVWPVARRMLASAALGMPLGLVVLLTVDERVLRLIIAVAVLAFVGLLLAGTAGFDRAFGERPAREGKVLLEQWRRTRGEMLAAFSPLGPKDRIPWFGPSMSALSFATARLMETWSHGQDVAVTLGRPIAPTDRLRHVAHIGVTTRGWSYANRGLAVPDGAVRVELRSPSGERWTWGPPDAADVVRGDALDFCLVVTQRRPLADTALEAHGPLAQEWMGYAQAFAGPPTETDPARAAG
jgi:uncharacterized protein (TIGR03084 family)